MAKNKAAEGLEARLMAAERLQTVLKGARFSPFDATEIADGRDRALANRLVTLALRRQGHLNLIMAELLERGLPKRSGSFEAVLRIALVELLFLESGAEHSAVFLAGEAVKQDKRAQHLVKLMNGVLRQAQREAARFMALPPEELIPRWLAARWRGCYGSDATGDFVKSLVEIVPLDLTLRDDDANLIAALRAQKLLLDSCRVVTRDRPVDALPGFAEGRFWVQDFSSALPARLFDLPKGARVLDMCAAPGGKTAQLIKAGYEVTALDADARRLERMGENLKRLGYAAELVVADGRTYRPQQKFDGVLLDAPCTATGTFRRHPEVLWHRTEKDIRDRAALQRELISNAVNCLNAGGVLVYSTCSLEAEEGEEQATWLLNSMPKMANQPIRPEELDGFAEPIDGQGWIRMHPARRIPGDFAGHADGFFVARFLAT